jgi:hypothetical protein
LARELELNETDVLRRALRELAAARLSNLAAAPRAASEPRSAEKKSRRTRNA